MGALLLWPFSFFLFQMLATCYFQLSNQEMFLSSLLSLALSLIPRFQLVHLFLVDVRVPNSLPCCPCFVCSVPFVKLHKSGVLILFFFYFFSFSLKINATGYLSHPVFFFCFKVLQLEWEIFACYSVGCVPSFLRTARFSWISSLTAWLLANALIASRFSLMRLIGMYF